MANFARLGDQIRQGQLIAPMLKLYFQKDHGARKPDGYFHPSSHPTMKPSELYLYLTDYEAYQAQKSPFTPEARMSMMVGTIMHDINRKALIELGLWQKPEGTCPCCKRKYGQGRGQCDEPGVADEANKQRGHMDGILKLAQKDKLVGYDLKTINAFAFDKAQPGLDYFKKTWPKYYGQMQSYMSMSPDMDEVIVLFQQVGYPWGFAEYTIPRDEEFIARMLAKYQKVLAAVEAGVMPGDEW